MPESPLVTTDNGDLDAALPRAVAAWFEPVASTPLASALRLRWVDERGNVLEHAPPSLEDPGEANGGEVAQAGQASIRGLVRHIAERRERRRERGRSFRRTVPWKPLLKP